MRVLADDGSPDVANPISNLRGRNDPKLAALERVDQDRRSGCAATCVELAKDRQSAESARSNSAARMTVSAAPF